MSASEVFVNTNVSLPRGGGEGETGLKTMFVGIVAVCGSLQHM